MKKKIVLSVVVLGLLFFIVGCEKKGEQTNSETNNSTYSNSTKSNVIERGPETAYNESTDILKMYSKEGVIVLASDDGNDRIVFNYNSDNMVTSYTSYNYYSSASEAQKKVESLKSSGKFKNVYVKENYLVVEHKEESFKGLTYKSAAKGIKGYKEVVKK